jgi:hypothetical protein
MTDEQTLCGESIRLDIDIGTGDAAQEAGLSDIGVPADQESSGVGINGRETTQMLPNLLQVDKRILQTSADGGHTTQGGTLELLALKQRLSIFDEADIVARHGFDEMLGGRYLAESDSEVVGVIKGVHQILV